MSDRAITECDEMEIFPGNEAADKSAGQASEDRSVVWAEAASASLVVQLQKARNLAGQQCFGQALG